MGSKTKVRILRAMYHQRRGFTIQEIADGLRLSFGTVHPALKGLVETRIVIGKKVGRSTLYNLNDSHILYEQIDRVFDRERNAYRDIAREAVTGLEKKGLVAAILFGSVARGDPLIPNDIDLLLISRDDSEYKYSRSWIDEIEMKYDVHFSILRMDQHEVKKRLRSFDNFILRLMDEGVVLHGDADWSRP